MRTSLSCIISKLVSWVWGCFSGIPETPASQIWYLNTILSPITHTLADIKLLRSKSNLFPLVFLWASELLTIIQKVAKLYLWLLHKIQTRPLFTLGFQAVGVATYITKFHTTFFIGNQVEKLIYRINLSKLAKQKMCQLGLRVFCQFYTIFYHSECFWCPGYKNRILMQVNLQWTL